MVFTLLVALFAFFYPQQEAQAMDPVTIAILAPIAIQVAKTMMPYIIKGLVNMGKMGLKMGKEMLNIMRLPLGVVQTFILFPFGSCFSSGIRNMGYGIIAPFKVAFYAAMLPISAFGVGV